MPRAKRYRESAAIPQPPLDRRPPSRPVPSRGGPSAADILAELQEAPQPGPSRGKLLRALKVEDAHSNNENTLYWYLWRTAGTSKTANRDSCRPAMHSYPKRSASTGRMCRTCFDSWKSKLSIRIVTPGTVRSATVYEVYSCEQILIRRKEVGSALGEKIRQPACGLRAGNRRPAPACPLGKRPSVQNRTWERVNKGLDTTPTQKSKKMPSPVPAVSC